MRFSWKTSLVLTIPILLFAWMASVKKAAREQARLEMRMDSIQVAADQRVAANDSMNREVAAKLAAIEDSAGAQAEQIQVLTMSRDKARRALSTARGKKDSLEALIPLVRTQDSTIAAMARTDTLRLRAIALLRLQANEKDRTIRDLQAAVHEATEGVSAPSPSFLKSALTTAVRVGACGLAGYGVGKENTALIVVGSGACAASLVWTP